MNFPASERPFLAYERSFQDLMARVGPRAQRLTLFLSCSLLVEVVNLLLGKDMAWDTLNYHLYAGFSAFTNRFDQDYFAAGTSSYLNPYIYLPFYLMVRAGWSALAISSVLALCQSTILWACFELGAACALTGNQSERFAVGISSLGLAFANPILLQQFGSCFADVLTAELVVLEWLLLVQGVRAPSPARIGAAAVLGGVATALKMTNAVHIVATIPLLALLPVNQKRKIKYVLLYGSATALAFVLVCAPWSWRLYQEFRNPLFPLLNSVFRSPYFTDQKLLHFRFIPSGLLDALIRPFAIVNPVNMVQEELRAPDIRYAALVLVGLGAVGSAVWRRVRSGAWGVPHFNEVNRPFIALAVSLTMDWVLWLTGSGNARYFIPAACVTAVVFCAALFALLRKHPKLRNYLLLGVFSVQGVQLAMGTEFRWNSAPWGGPWFNLEIPAQLKNDDSLFLTIGMESNSYVIPFLDPRAGFINVSGGYALGPGGAEGMRIKELIARHGPKLRVLVTGRALYDDGDSRNPHRSLINEELSRFALQVDRSDCQIIVVHGLTPEIEPIILHGSAPILHASRDTSYLVSCHLIPASGPTPEEIREGNQADAALNNLEDACPALFQPKRLLTEHVGRAWMRRYVNTDLTAWVSRGEVKFLQAVMGAKTTYLGSEKLWAADAIRLQCYRRDGVYMANAIRR